VGDGCWPSVDAACEATIRITGKVEPNSEAARRYEDVYSIYRVLYPALRASFNKMGA
jgi:xylulokinase